MIGIQEMLVAVANAPREIAVVIDVAGNGKALMPVSSIEVKDGRLVIACEAPAATAKPQRAAKPATTASEQTVKVEPAPAPATPAPSAPVADAGSPVTEMTFETEAKA